MARILLVEDHQRLAALVCGALARVGIEADTFADIAAAWQALSLHEYGVLILDRGLPDGDGLVLLHRMRAAGNRMPCLVMTARDAVHDRIEGLESGADDYLSKPFAMEELVARVRALMRRPATEQSLTPVFGDLVLMPETGCMQCAEASISLAPAEIQIMFVLLQANGTVVQRKKLEQAAWGLGEAVTSNALDVALHRLRKKLLGIGSAATIENIRGQGYAMCQTSTPA